jgi:hypothetical protein
MKDWSLLGRGCSIERRGRGLLSMEVLGGSGSVEEGGGRGGAALSDGGGGGMRGG